MLIEPLASPPQATVEIPGSKSITNRALVAAILAPGQSQLRGALLSDDTKAMIGVARCLGASVATHRRPNGDNADLIIEGTGETLTAGPVDLDVNMSGTTARFSVPLVARGHGTYVVDGHPAMRARPMAEAADALRQLGTPVAGDHLPLTIEADGGHGGAITVGANVSSQFVSGLLLSAPGLTDGLTITIDGPVVSMPYLTMTVEVMRAFGAEVSIGDGQRVFTVAPDRGYQAADYRIEPDASAASYFFAAAAVTGGTVRVDGLSADALQGDVGFVRVLEQMGASVTWGAEFVEVTGPEQLSGVTVDMSDISDTAQTLAAIAPFASGPTRVTGIGFIRAKETDRVGAVVTELQRLGVDATEEPDGFVIEPGDPQPATVQTYDDHRMAMSFSIVGLLRPGITIADPGCVAKTFPSYFATLDQLRH